MGARVAPSPRSGLRLLLLVAVISVGLVARAVHAVCPTNGDPRVLYVTANGDRGFHDILMLDTSGRVVGTAINWTSVPKAITLKKLRGMTFGPDGKLYVASALAEVSKIVVFAAELEDDCTRRFEKVLTSIGDDQRYLKHPYDIIAVPSRVMRPGVGDRGSKKHPAFTLMSSNQNTVSVTWMNGLDGTPIPSPEHTLSHLKRNAAREAKRKAAAAAAAEDDQKSADSRKEGGASSVVDEVANSTSAPLSRDREAEFIKMGIFTAMGSGEEQATRQLEAQYAYALQSVRGVALSPDGAWLIIADVDADALRVFELPTGRYLWSIPVPTPIQVLVAPEGFLNLDGAHPTADVVPHLLVTSKTENIFVVPLVSPTNRGAIGKLIYLTMEQARGHRHGSSDAAAANSHLSPAQRFATYARSHDQSGTAPSSYEAYDDGGGEVNFRGGPSRLGPDGVPLPSRASVLAPRVFASGFVSTSGIEVDPQAGVVYIADRVERRLSRVRFDGAPLGVFGPAFRDQPEHLLLVQVADPKDLPRCYELGEEGLKYSVICVAGWVWLVMIIGGAVMLYGMWKSLRAVPQTLNAPASIVTSEDRRSS